METFERVQIRAGSGTDFGKVAGITYANVTSVSEGTGGGIEVDLHSFSVAANTFNADKNTLQVMFSGEEKTNSLAKVVKVYFAGTAIYTSPSMSGIGHWNIQVTIIRTSSTAVHYNILFIADTGTNASPTVDVLNGTLAGLTLTGANTLKTTHTTTGSGATPYATEYFALANFIQQ